MGCYREIWQRRHDRSDESYNNEINKIERTGDCYFLKFRPEKTLESAKEFIKKIDEDSRFKKTRTVAIASIVISTIFGALTILRWILEFTNRNVV